MTKRTDILPVRGRPRTPGTLTATFAGAVLASLVLAQTALGATAGPRNYTYYNPNPRFAGSWIDLTETKTGSTRRLTLARHELWSHDLGDATSPHSVVRLPAGTTLVADEAGRRVVELDTSGRVVWEFGAGDEPSLAGPVSAHPSASGDGILIADPAGRQVLEVSREGAVLWSYGPVDDSALRSPTSARVVPGSGDVLIADPGAGRVIQVSRAKAVTWSSTVARTPRSAVRLASGETLVVDEERHRVVAVNTGGGAVSWSFGVDGASGADSSHLNAPTAAERLEDGSTLIADSGNGRVLRVDENGALLDAYGTGGTASPDSVATDGGVWPTSGGVLVADPDTGQIAEIGYVTTGVYETGDLDLGVPGVNKWVTEILPDVTTPAGTSVRVFYSLNGGAWQRAGSGTDFYIEDSKPAGFIRMRVDLATEDPGVSPVLNRLNAAFYLAEPPVYRPKPKPKPGSGSGDSTRSAGATGTAGTGSSGSGSGGVALGAGSGSGSGMGGISLGAGAPRNAEVVAVNVTEDEAGNLLSGFLLDEKSLATEPQSGGGALVDPAGLLAAAILLSFAYALGVSSPVTRVALEAAVRPLRRIVLGSLNG